MNHKPIDIRIFQVGIIIIVQVTNTANTEFTVEFRSSNCSK